jgi:DNA polymerase V
VRWFFNPSLNGKPVVVLSNNDGCAVALLDIVPENEVQFNLFVKFDSSKHKNLMEAMDSINSHWGRETVRSGASGYERFWSIKRARLSPRYTTKWNEVLTAK